jgi:hypothetical protein
MRPAVALILAFTLEAQTPNYLKDYFDSLLTAGHTEPAFDDYLKIADQIEATPAALIAAALPTMKRVLDKGGPERKAVMTPLFAISRRRDSLVLLKPYLHEILACLRDPETGVARAADIVLMNFYPEPVDSVVPVLISDVNDKKVNEEIQSLLIGTLTAYAPNDPQVIDTITHFMQLKHTLLARENALNGIANGLSDRHRYSPELVQLIIQAIERDSETRLTSVQALGRCGRKAYGVAMPILSKIAHDDHEQPEIRKLAEGAIDSIQHSAH